MSEIDKSKCRAGSGPSFHVDYTIDEDNEQTENLSHVAETDTEAIDERGDKEVHWTVDLRDDRSTEIQLFVSDNEEQSWWTLAQKITAETAEQLSDMFGRIAQIARQREEKQRQELAEIAASQENLFTEAV